MVVIIKHFAINMHVTLKVGGSVYRWSPLTSKKFDLFAEFNVFPQFSVPQVERGSPKSCFLFMGEVLCEVNWVSVLSDHLQTPPTATAYPALPDMGTQKESHAMLVYLLYMLVFLAKEEPLLSQQVSPGYFGVTLGSGPLAPSVIPHFLHPQDSPLLSLLVQSTSLPWHQLDQSSYQSILGYVGTHYPPSLFLSVDSAPQLVLKLLRSAAGLHPRPSETPHPVRQYRAVCLPKHISDLLRHCQRQR